MDIRDPFKSVWICVQNCPKFNMDANVDFHSYRNGSGVELCLYDTVDYLDEVTNPRTTVGPCPLVVFNRLDQFDQACAFLINFKTV